MKRQRLIIRLRIVRNMMKWLMNNLMHYSNNTLRVNKKTITTILALSMKILMKSIPVRCNQRGIWQMTNSKLVLFQRAISRVWSPSSRLWARWRKLVPVRAEPAKISQKPPSSRRASNLQIWGQVRKRLGLPNWRQVHPRRHQWLNNHQLRQQL